MWNSCCRGPTPGLFLSGLVKSLPEFPSLLKTCKSQNLISCHLFSLNACTCSLWTKQLHSLALVPEGFLNGSFSAAGQGMEVWWHGCVLILGSWEELSLSSRVCEQGPGSPWCAALTCDTLWHLGTCQRQSPTFASIDPIRACFHFVGYSLSESLSVQGNSLLVWKGGKGKVLIVSSSFHPCRSTATASHPNSYCCLCKLRVRNCLSREIAGKAGAAGRGWAEESCVCTGSKVKLLGQGACPEWGNSWLQTQPVLQLSCHSQWLWGIMVKPPWKNPNSRSEGKAIDLLFFSVLIIQCLLWLYIEVSLQRI